ncbi:hypothetical protein GQ55_2G280400 [Panicum hallii var. hallii]|uniref:Uncharacterized protein n=1 Tax=Panicum hallii var. hallii TaxID=1504633 RepID=A0A2T7ET53_9POAL|nr:hypothetical protein GQ55_2G280400 [Panicum hallii var. hallii]
MHGPAGWPYDTFLFITRELEGDEEALTTALTRTHDSILPSRPQPLLPCRRTRPLRLAAASRTASRRSLAAAAATAAHLNFLHCHGPAGLCILVLLRQPTPPLLPGDLEVYAGYDQLLRTLQDKFFFHFTIHKEVPTYVLSCWTQ